MKATRFWAAIANISTDEEKQFLFRANQAALISDMSYCRGFTPSMMHLMRQDLLLDRPDALRKPLICWTNEMFCTVFRGTVNPLTMTFDGVDVPKVRLLLKEEDAFSVIIKTAIALACRCKVQPRETCESLRDVLRTVNSIASIREFAQIILNRAQSYFKDFQELFKVTRNQVEAVDPGEATEGLVFQLIAILDIYSTKLKLDPFLKKSGILAIDPSAAGLFKMIVPIAQMAISAANNK